MVAFHDNNILNVISHHSLVCIFSYPWGIEAAIMNSPCTPSLENWRNEPVWELRGSVLSKVTSKAEKLPWDSRVKP